MAFLSLSWRQQTQVAGKFRTRTFQSKASKPKGDIVLCWFERELDVPSRSRASLRLGLHRQLLVSGGSYGACLKAHLCVCVCVHVHLCLRVCTHACVFQVRLVAALAKA